MNGVSYVEVYNSVWRGVDNVNLCKELAIVFTSSHDKQIKIANMFAEKLSVGFDNCVGTVDGILIWTKKLVNMY